MLGGFLGETWQDGRLDYSMDRLICLIQNISEVLKGVVFNIFSPSEIVQVAQKLVKSTFTSISHKTTEYLCTIAV